MTTIRVAKRLKYLTVDRKTVRDPNISYRALGVLAWMLDHPADWETNAEQIAKARPGGEGRDAIRKVLKELRAAGYMRLRKWRDATGRFQSEWSVFERPVENEPERISSAGDQRWLPAAENQGLKDRSTSYVTEDSLEGGRAANDDVDASGDPNCERCHGRGWNWSRDDLAFVECECRRPSTALEAVS